MVIGVATLAQTNPHTEKESEVDSGLCELLRSEGLSSGESGEKNFPRFQMMEASLLPPPDIMVWRQEAKTQCSYFCHQEETQPEKANMQSGCSQGGWSQRRGARTTAGLALINILVIQSDLNWIFLLLSTQSRQTAKFSQATLREISRCLVGRATCPAA